MRGSFALCVAGLTLAAACAFGTEGPTDRHLGSDTTSGTSSGDDSGSVGTMPPPGSGSQGSGGSSGSGGSGGTYGGGSSGGSGGYGGSGSSSYEAGGSSYEGGSYYESGSSYEAGTGTTTAACMGYAPPTMSASCTACSSPPCQANGCYGGYWCEMSTSKCHSSPPSGC